MTSLIFNCINTLFKLFTLFKVMEINQYRRNNEKKLYFTKAFQSIFKCFEKIFFTRFIIFCEFKKDNFSLEMSLLVVKV